MSKQWVFVGLVVAGLAGGAIIMTQLGNEVTPVAVGSVAPDFKAIDLATGDSVSLHERYRGKVTLINIWATGCVPCRVEMPSMQQVYDSLAPQGFAIAAVSIDEGGPGEVREFGSQLGLSFDLLQDRSGQVQQLYQTNGVPESFLLDRHGVIVKRIISAHDWD